MLLPSSGRPLPQRLATIHLATLKKVGIVSPVPAPQAAAKAQLPPFLCSREGRQKAYQKDACQEAVNTEA